MSFHFNTARPGTAAHAPWCRLGLPSLLVLAGLAAATASATPVGRPPYHGHCEIPRVGWNEEILHAREAAARECKENTLRLASDRSALVATDAQDHFWEMKSQHDALLRRLRETATAH